MRDILNRNLLMNSETSLIVSNKIITPFSKNLATDMQVNEAQSMTKAAR